MKGHAAVAELVARSGFDTVFAMLGGSNVPWIGHGVAEGTLRLIKTRHEDAAVTAAVGYARSTGAPALCSVTRGPGFTNAITALVNATKGHTPILVITGEAMTPRLPSQNVDQAALVAAIGAGYTEVTESEAVEPAFHEAMRALHRTGTPQVLAIHSSLFGAEVPEPGEPPAFPPVVPAPAADLDSTAARLAEARYPLILAGTGADFAGTREQLIALAEATGARLTTTLRALNMFAGHPADLGLCGGWSPPVIREQLGLADVVLAVGASLNDFTTDKGTLFPDAEVIHVELDPTLRQGAVRPATVLHADASSVIAGLLERSEREPSASEWGPVPPRDQLIDGVMSPDIGHDPARGIDPRELYARLDALLPQDRVIVTDSGRFLGTLPNLIASTDSRSWHVGNGYSSIGLGIGQAIGAAAAFPDRPVVLLAGDGGFAMASHDLDAFRLNGLSAVIVIVNDELYGSDVKYLRQNGLPTSIIEQSLPDIPALAAAYGGRGIVIRTLAELDAVDFGSTGLTILDVRVDPGVNVRQVTAGWSETSTDRSAYQSMVSASVPGAESE